MLPLDNFSPDASDAYLAGGMTEELTSCLSKISGLEVLALEAVPCRAVDIESDDTHAGARQAPRHVAAHPTQTDDSDFQGAAFQNQSCDATAASVNARTPGRWPAWLPR